MSDNTIKKPHCSPETWKTNKLRLVKQPFLLQDPAGRREEKSMGAKEDFRRFFGGFSQKIWGEGKDKNSFDIDFLQFVNFFDELCKTFVFRKR